MFGHDPTWNKELGQHTCCGSKHTYHKTNCPNRRSMVMGRLSDPDFIKVQDCKAEGYSSGQCASLLNMPLEQVNDLWLV